MSKQQKKKQSKGKQQQPSLKAGIPKDWICPNIPLPLDIKYCDLQIKNKQYLILLTQYVYSQMYRKQIKHFKDAAKYIKDAIQQQEQGTWNVVCGINFGSFFSYQTKGCILLYWSSVGFLIWKYG